MNIQVILHELKEHAPFTALAVLIAIFLVILLQYFLQVSLNEDVFHIAHFLHVIVSAIATAAIYYRYKKSFIKALIIGTLGALIIGSLSDVIFPYLGGLIIDSHMHFHLPIIEETFLTLGLAIFGALVGIFIKISKIPHLLHVFLSVFASLFYLLTFTSSFNLIYFIIVFFIVFLAVILPCCLSDIAFPLFFCKKCKSLEKN
jgi:hypothetical protein